MRTSTLAYFGQLAAIAYADVSGISTRDLAEEMEHVMVDQYGYNEDPFVAAITPCSTYLTNKTANLGEQSTAQWVRIAFHDFVTGNQTSGLGGLDASISFESNRDENAGLFINDTINFFSPIMSAYMSISDAIVLGVAMSVAVCGGSDSAPGVRVGRIDAHEAGPAGVPTPFSDLETTLAAFEKVGFTASETIAVTACGHSLGRVHYSNFPDLVPESYVTSTDLDGGDSFDETPAAFDNAVVTEYLDGTGKFGGLLVTASNVSARSDYRLYISDSNATMTSLADNFESTCATLFEKMLNVVPATVTLSDVVTPMTWKAIEPSLNVASNGSVTIAGDIRYLYNISTTTAAESVSYNTTSTSGVLIAETNGTSGTGYGMYGNSTFYTFNSTVASGTTQLAFGDITYPINMDLFVERAKSSLDGDLVNVYAAALTTIATASPVATFYVPVAQDGATVAKQISNETVTLTEYATAGDYTLYSGAINLTTGAGASFGHVIGKLALGSSASQSFKADFDTV